MIKLLIQIETAPGTKFPDMERLKRDLKILAETAVELNTRGPIPSVTITEEERESQ